MRSLVARLIHEDEGVDIVEYALLGAFIGTVGILVWQSIGTGISGAFQRWNDPTTGIQSLSCMPDPGGGGC